MINDPNIFTKNNNTLLLFLKLKCIKLYQVLFIHLFVWNNFMFLSSMLNRKFLKLEIFSNFLEMTGTFRDDCNIDKLCMLSKSSGLVLSRRICDCMIKNQQSLNIQEKLECTSDLLIKVDNCTASDKSTSYFQKPENGVC